jgi:hypothetical protein
MSPGKEMSKESTAQRIFGKSERAFVVTPDAGLTLSLTLIQDELVWAQSTYYTQDNLFNQRQVV